MNGCVDGTYRRDTHTEEAGGVGGGPPEPRNARRPQNRQEGFLRSPQWARSPADSLVSAPGACGGAGLFFQAPGLRSFTTAAPGRHSTFSDPQCRALEGSEALGRGLVLKRGPLEGRQGVCPGPSVVLLWPLLRQPGSGLPPPPTLCRAS